MAKMDLVSASRSVILALLIMAGGCNEATPHKHKAVPYNGPHTVIVGLPDGGSIAVANGSTEQDMAAFFASKDPAPRTFRLPTDQFKHWAVSPDPRIEATVSAITLILRSYPKSKIRIVGYTDDIGTADANQALSEKRAAKLKQIFVDRGISPDRIDTEGKGAAEPIGDNATEAGQARNRRIEIVILNK